MQTSLFRKTAMLIEHNPVHCRLYEDILEANGFEVYTAKSVMDALLKIKDKTQDLTVVNTEIAGEQFLQKFISNVKGEERTKNMPIIGISMYSKEKKKNVAKILDGFLTKPFSIDTFVESISKCIEGKNGTEDTNYQ